MRNPNRAMLEETGLVIDDQVIFRDEMWNVDGAVFLPQTTNLHCITLSRKGDGGEYSTASHSNQFNELHLVETVGGE